MLACGHSREAFGDPVCVHLRQGEPWVSYVMSYLGPGLSLERLCLPCVEQREKGAAVDAERVCEECFDHATNEVGDLTGVRGKPAIRTRVEPFDDRRRRTALSVEIGTVLDMAPVEDGGRPLWLLLAEGGRLIRLDADSGEWATLASTTVPDEPDHKPWCGQRLTRRLHVSRDGRFAAVVNDCGRWGQVIDLRSGKVTLTLDGGNYHPETVPFSFAFSEAGGRVVAVHRTAWNRLDISDPDSGRLLTERDPTSCKRGEQRPPHYLDYFHGGLHVSPAGTHVLDDGWVWHPVGAPVAWSLKRWCSDNVWESEDGPSRASMCARSYYWDGPLTWIDDSRVAIGGIGDDDIVMVDGARIFDVTTRSEIATFPGPTGRFFSDGTWLFSSDETGLSRWDPSSGERTGHLPGFQPTHHHRSARELACVIGGALVRWSDRD